MSRFPLMLPALALLAACAGQPQEPVVSAPVEPEPSEPVEVPERAIPAESLYPLLLAEFALRRREYDVALDQYMAQAPMLRDPGVSAHTTHLTQFLQREPEALEAVELWVELEPDNLEARNTLATLLVRRGRAPEALPHLAVVQRGGQDANFPIVLHGYDQLDDLQQAQIAARIDALANEFPDQPELLLSQALILGEKGENKAALKKLDQLLELEPERNQALLLEARLLLEDGARRPFARIESTLKANPGDQRLRLQYARILTRHDMNEARKQFEILSANAPEDPDLLFSLALINQEMGDNLAAKAYLKQLLDTGKRQNDAHYYLGRIAEDEEDINAALNHYMAVTAGNEFLAANSRVGQILLDRGQFNQSATYFRGLRARYPALAERLYAMESDLLTQAGHLDASMALLNVALTDMPDSSTLRYTRSMLGEKQDDLTLMESDLRAIIEKDPINATALNALGYTLADRTDRLDEAYELIRQALLLEPDEPAILDSMGWVLYRMGRLDESLEYLQKAYARFPDPEVAAHLGEVLWMKGEQSAAREIWQQALVEDPEHDVLLSTLERLGVTDLAPASASQ